MVLIGTWAPQHPCNLKFLARLTWAPQNWIFFHPLLPPFYAFRILTSEDRDKLRLLAAFEGLFRLCDVSWVSAGIEIKECWVYGGVSFQLTFYSFTLDFFFSFLRQGLVT